MEDVEEGKVAVYVRCRPLSTEELVGLGRSCVTVPGSSSSSASPGSIMIGDRKSDKRKAFVFDQVFDEEVTQGNMYEVTCQPLVEGLFEGFNASILAYGQTGSGKTFTMGTAVDSMGTEDEGIVPRVVKHIFGVMEEKRAQNKIVNVRVSFLEILNEDCRDLLHPEVDSKDIQIREDTDGHIFFTGAREEAASSAEALLGIFERGCLGRTTASTKMNATSSRSHAIFTIGIEMFDCNNGSSSSNKHPNFNNTASCMQAKLQLVDLAGSERAKKTGANGERLKQSVGINQGLLALGKVIRALTTQGKQSSSATGSGGRKGKNESSTKKFVPYRESRLTRLLQDSLGGNSRTVFIACVSSSVLNLHETLSTLQYASRTKAIRNKVVANVTVAPHPEAANADSAAVESLRARLREMENQVAAYRDTNSSSSGGGGGRGGGGLRKSWPVFDVSTLDSVEALDYTQLAGAVKKIRSDLRAALQALSSAGPGTLLALGGGGGGEGARSSADMEHRFGVAKGLIVSCRDAVTALGSIVELAMAAAHREREHAAAMDNTLGGRPGAAATGDMVPAEEISRLQEELAECREDLTRDEEIFAEKVRELKRARKENRQLTSQTTQLEKQVHDLESEISALRQTSALAQIQTRGQNVSRTGMQSLSGSSTVLVEGEGDLDMVMVDVELDESLALVASTEPDVSQLMDDLEAVNKEKERLLTEKRRAEEESERAASRAHKQREDASSAAADMGRRLRELEIGMRMKQSVITKISSSANEERHRRAAAEEAYQQERKAREDLELELDDVTVRSGRSHRSTRTAHTETSSAMGAVRRSNDTQRLQLEVELASMRKEHSKLSAALDSNQTRQQRQVEVLTAQVTKHRKQTLESQTAIKALEERNRDLQARLTKMNWRRGGVGGAKQETKAEYAQSTVSVGGGVSVDRTSLMKRVARIAQNQLLRADMDRLRDKIAEAEAETLRLRHEHAQLLGGSGEGTVYTRAVEVEEELETLDAELELHRSNLAALQRQANPAWATSRRNRGADGSPRAEGKSQDYDSDAGKHGEDGGDVDESRGDGRSSDTCDALLADLQRLEEGQSNILLMGAVRDLVASKFSTLRDDGTVGAVRAELEHKQAEVDDLQRQVYRAKSDAARRIDSVRQDCDAKVTFLLSQLRATERQVREHGALARRSVELLRSSSEVPPPPEEQHCQRPEPAHTRAEGAAASSPRSNRGDFEAERRRRELLEKRNGELVRELRKLRSSVTSVDS